MIESPGQRDGRRWLAVGLGRLRRARWLLAAAIVSVLSVWYVGEGSPAFLVATIAALLLVAVAAPSGRRQVAVRPAPGGSPPERLSQDLSAVDLAAAVADALIVFDRSGVVRFANTAAIAAFGDVPAGISLPLRFRAPEIQTLLETTFSGRSATATVDYAERVPVERVYRVTATAVGRGTGLYVIVFRDQSEALRIDRMRADFIANASHELRTPLASISGFVETLRGPAKNDAAARDQFLQIMQGQTARMARLIDDLLSLSRLEMKAGNVGTAEVDLAQIVAAVVGSLGPLAAESAVTVENELGAAPLPVRGDRDELFQVFENLVENACKYGQAGGRVVIARTPDLEPHEVGVTVRDFGPGIAEEHIPRITERFYRIDSDAGRSPKGTGLGLSIVKHILTRHRGRLAVSSQLGKGAAFSAIFPVARPEGGTLERPSS